MGKVSARAQAAISWSDTVSAHERSVDGANSKYVQTEFGTKRLKEFFSESLSTQDGEEVSTLEVKKILSDLVGEENKRRPLSDEKLKSLLMKSGYNIARRTVAKYREQLNIPVARLRKAL